MKRMKKQSILRWHRGFSHMLLHDYLKDLRQDGIIVSVLVEQYDKGGFAEQVIIIIELYHENK